MTFAELEGLLPNGFHDSALRNLAIDYQRRTLRLEMSILVGVPDDPKEHRDDYRHALLEFTGVAFVVIEPPDRNYEFDSPGELSFVDAYELQNLNAPDEKVPPLPSGSFGIRFFVNDWNSLIYVAARDCKIEWLGEAYSYRGGRQHFLPGESIPN